MSLVDRFQIKQAACMVVILCGGLSTAYANDTKAFTEQTLMAQGAHLSHHRQTGQVNFIGSNAGQAIALPGTGTPQNPTAAAMDALNAYGKIFGLINPSAELTQKSLRTTANGRSIARYQQNYNGIPVIGGEMIVNLSPNNGLLSINGEISPKLAIPTQATVTAQQATDTALGAVAKWYTASTSTLAASTPVLSAYDPRLIGPDTSPAGLVWRIEISSTTLQPIRELILIDAIRGNIRLHFNQVDTALLRKTYNANETSALPGTLVCDESDPTCSVGDRDAVNAHQFAKDTYDFYFNNHARDSIDGAGMTIISTTHWNNGTDCPNAFWDGSRMVYCSGMMADDVVAHELTHGVTERESNLFYYYQAGAINESLSDVWGEFVDLGNGLGNDSPSVRWQLGEDINVGSLTGPIRHMNDPTIDYDPDKMSSNYYNKDPYFTDNGGVHTNSGINNKAVYLMVDGSSAETGGAFNGQTVTGIGITKAAKIYYEVQTNLLTSGADYLDLYNALYQGCQNLVGSSGITINDCNQVRAATTAVEMNIDPTGSFNPDTAMCPTGQGVATTIFSDDFENGLSKWTVTHTIGTFTNWVAWNATYGATYGPNATSGIESLFGDDVATTSDQRAAISVTLPAGQSYLHFRHAFDFETSAGNAYDGGVLEYSINGGNTWTDASSLFDTGINYNGTLYPATNPLYGRSAYTGTSHGYVSSRFNLLSLANQTVQFRWRVGTDNSVAGTYGWFLDDVNIYSCAATSYISFSSPTYTVAETGATATITVSRTGSSVGAVSVNYSANSGSATAGSDYTATTGTLNWANGDTANKTFTVTTIDDSYYEGTETVDLILSSPSGAVLGTQPSASLAITDNDAASTVGFSNATYSVAENGASVLVTVNRDTVNSTGPASIHYLATSGTATVGSDFALASGTLNWAAGDSTAKTFTVTINDDSIYEGDETVSLALSNPVGAVIGTGSATLTIIENDPVTSPTLAFSAANYTVTENGTRATITVSRGGSSIGAVSVNYSTTPGSATSGKDYYTTSGLLSWPAGDMTNRSFNVSIIDDTTTEGDETVNLALTNPSGASLGSNASATLTITDNDSSSGGGTLGWPFLLFGLLLLPLRRRLRITT